MAGTYLGYPFDPEIFLYNWNQLQEITTEAMLGSGAMVNDATIAGMISNGSDVYTMPFYNLISANFVNYDGATDITSSETDGTTMSGIVYGRAMALTAKDFIGDFNSGADPMSVIQSKVSKIWAKEKQEQLINILNAIFNISGNEDWENHTTNLSASGSGSITDGNKIDATTIGDAIVKAAGDKAYQYSMAIMHSQIANALAKIELLKYRTYTDPTGIQRQLNIADINGLTVIVDDGVPVATSSAVSGAKEYTTYLFGNGAIRTADAPVDHPVEVDRDPYKNGGQDTLITRQRKTIMPYGFSYTKPTSGYTSSPTDAQLGDVANWSIVENPKNIPIARVITNG
jgi:hypothetical protein